MQSRPRWRAAVCTSKAETLPLPSQLTPLWSRVLLDSVEKMKENEEKDAPISNIKSETVLSDLQIS